MSLYVSYAPAGLGALVQARLGGGRVARASGCEGLSLQRVAEDRRRRPASRCRARCGRRNSRSEGQLGGRKPDGALQPALLRRRRPAGGHRAPAAGFLPCQRLLVQRDPGAPGPRAGLLSRGDAGPVAVAALPAEAQRPPRERDALTARRPPLAVARARSCPPEQLGRREAEDRFLRPDDGWMLG